MGIYKIKANIVLWNQLTLQLSSLQVFYTVIMVLNTFYKQYNINKMVLKRYFMTKIKHTDR